MDAGAVCRAAPRARVVRFRPLSTDTSLVQIQRRSLAASEVSPKFHVRSLQGAPTYREFCREHMDFFHFGPDQLFGSFSPAQGEPSPGTVAVLCYPFGQEYMRAHRAYRQLATLISREGVPVFRFDYFGTGDSAGSGEDAALERWVENVRSAMDEARRRAGVERVRLVGLRLGGTLAALAAQGADRVEELVLWDPVVGGTGFVQQVRSRGVTEVGSTWWVDGFPLPSHLRSAIEGVDLSTLELPSRTRILMMISHEGDDFTQMARGLEHRSADVEVRLVPSPSNWNYADAVGGILLPRDMVRAVVDATVR